MQAADQWVVAQGRTALSITLAPGQSIFVVFQRKTTQVGTKEDRTKGRVPRQLLAEIPGDWRVQFDTAYGGPATPVLFSQLVTWDQHPNDAIRYYSGRAVYSHQFSIPPITGHQPVYLTIDSIFNLATVRINGVDCGTLWTQPYRLDISKALRPGQNKIQIEVSNTWANRLIGDMRLPEHQRITWTTAPLSILEGKPLLKAGLEGRVRIEQ